MISFLTFITESKSSWPTIHTIAEMKALGFEDTAGIIDDFLTFYFKNISISDTQHLIIHNNPIKPLYDQIKQSNFDNSGLRRIKRLMKAMQNGITLPPIVVYKDELWDGRHRITAAYQLGLHTVPCIHLEDYTVEGMESSKR